MSFSEAHSEVIVTGKALIVEHLGAAGILLPGLVQDGLRANDRAKVRMSVLQTAMRGALSPSVPAAGLSREAADAGLNAAEIERLIHGARRLSTDRANIPGADTLIRELYDDVDRMVVAIEASRDRAATEFRARLTTLRDQMPIDRDIITEATVTAITTASVSGNDSLHRLIMDLHKALNRLSIQCAEEVVAGAHAYGLSSEDRPCVEAFMRGIEATRRLKFDHPGLETTAARSDGRLVIQNDIGTSDAHVVLVSVTTDEISVTYTDLHRGRAKFFIGLFGRFSAQWSDLSSDNSDRINHREAFFLITGRFVSSDQKEREQFLEAVGAALVFLIDWNKARKSLRQFIGKAEATKLLAWSAAHRIGHRAFLQLGGVALINESIRRVAPSRIGYGVRIDEALGPRGAFTFLMAVFRLCSEALLAQRAERLVRDGVDAELARHLQSTQSELLYGIIRQAGLARDIASRLAERIEELRRGHDTCGLRLAASAKHIEEKADRLTIELRASALRFGASDHIARVIDAAEQAIDDLEEAAFVLSLLSSAGAGAAAEALLDLAWAAVHGAAHLVRAADAVSTAPNGLQVDADDALEALSDLNDIEHASDLLERRVLASVIGTENPPSHALGLIECSRKIENATDHFARAAHSLRALVIGELTH